MTNKPDTIEIQDAIRKKYAEISCSAEGKFNYPTGKNGAISLGYDTSIIESMPNELIESFCGVGNPFTLGPINSGETIIDVGCGAGFDLFYASRMVGQTGKVCGIDLTSEMVEKAKLNLKHYGVSNYDVQIAEVESVPYQDSTFDVAISNGVLNLSPLKEKSFREIYRVLKPNGRLQFADIVLKEDSPLMRSTLEAWSN